MSLAIEFQSNPVVSLTRRLAARRDEILYVIEAAIPKRLGICLLRMRTI